MLVLHFLLGHFQNLESQFQPCTAGTSFCIQRHRHIHVHQKNKPLVVVKTSNPILCITYIYAQFQLQLFLEILAPKFQWSVRCPLPSTKRFSSDVADLFCSILSNVSGFFLLSISLDQRTPILLYAPCFLLNFVPTQ